MLKHLLASVTLTLTTLATAGAQDARVGHAAPNPDLYFSAQPVFHPGIASQINTIEIVECLSKPLVEKRLVHTRSRKAMEISASTWNIRVVSGEKERVGKEFICRAPSRNAINRADPFELGHRYLLFGIRGKPTEELPWGVQVARFLATSAPRTALIDSTSKDVFVLGMIPTRLSKLEVKTVSQGAALQALAQNMLGEASDDAVRQGSNLLLTFHPDVPPFDTIDGTPANEWLTQNLLPALQKQTKRSSVQQLRFDGLSLQWGAPGINPAFALSLPKLLTQLGVAHARPVRSPFDPPTGVDDDLAFIGWLNLSKGLTGKQILEIAYAFPWLLGSLLSGNLNVMQDEDQKSLYQLASHLDLYTRSRVYNLLSVWNGEPGLTSTVFLPPGPTNGSQEIIDKESTIVAFWNKKFNIGAKP